MKRTRFTDGRLASASQRLNAIARRIEQGHPLGEIAYSFHIQTDALRHVVLGLPYRPTRREAAITLQRIIDHAIQRVSAGDSLALVSRELGLTPAVEAEVVRQAAEPPRVAEREPPAGAGSGKKGRPKNKSDGAESERRAS